MNIFPRFVLCSLLVILISCASNKTSTIVGFDYNEKDNTTDYFVFPFGSVTIPGKWNKTNYNSISRQQFFKNSDSVTIAIAFVPCDKFEFNIDKSKTDFEFIKAYYDWDSHFFVSQHGLESKVLEMDSTNNYIIWKLWGKLNDEKIENYFLFGEKNCFVSNFSILSTNKWSEKEKIK